MKVRSTTILAVRRDGKLAIAGDGQVTLDKTIVKHGARKVRKTAGGKVVARRAGCGRFGEGWVVGQDLPLEPLQDRPGLDPVLPGKHRARIGEGRQCLGSPAATVEGQHQLPPHPLVCGVRRCLRA